MNLKALFTKHDWVTDAELNDRTNYLYQVCAKTGDRRVITSRRAEGFEAILETWLMAATSGTYFIDGEKFTLSPEKKDIIISTPTT